MKDGPKFRARLDKQKRGVGHALIRAARFVHEAGLRRVQADERFRAVRQSHLSLMPHLDLDGTRVSEIARRMQITKQAVGQLVDELEGLGVVERGPDPTDRRAKLVHFTDFGRDTMLVGLEALAAVDEEMLAGLSPRRREALGRDLMTIQATLEGRLVEADATKD